MTLSAADVAEIMRLVEQSDFDELSLEMEGVKLTLRKTGAAPIAQVDEVPMAVAPAGRSAAAPVAATASPADDGSAAAADPALAGIASPLLGTFYRAPKPGAAPYVDVGSMVEEQTVIAIIEVMKLMNTVRAGVKGRVEQILPADGTLVEFGEVLMRVRRAD